MKITVLGRTFEKPQSIKGMVDHLISLAEKGELACSLKNEPYENGYYGCLYRSSRKSACFIGHFLPDGFEEMDDMGSIRYLVQGRGGWAKQFNGFSIYLLMGLQAIHDSIGLRIGGKKGLTEREKGIAIKSKALSSSFFLRGLREFDKTSSGNPEYTRVVEAQS